MRKPANASAVANAGLWWKGIWRLGGGGLRIAPVHFLAETLQRFTGVLGNVGIVGVGEAVEVRPQESQTFLGGE